MTPAAGGPPRTGSDTGVAPVVASPCPRLLKAWRGLEQFFDRAYGAALNPLRQLGALGFLAFWLLAVSGVWLYVVLDTSVSGAYGSIEGLSSTPWSPGGLMRSLHRYAADAFVLFTVGHLLREAIHGRWRHVHRFSWLTGAALLPLIAASAIGGFWLNWDQLGQFSAIATAEWLGALPLLAQPLARNFLGAAAVSDRLFSLFVFVHIGAPLLLVFGLWFHIQRITRAVVFPPRGLALGMLGTLLVLAVLAPVASQGPADLTRVPALLSMDWVLLFVHPLMYATSAGFTLALALGTLAALLLLPLLPAPARLPVALVEPTNCNGCRRCFADCPYAAITMAPHPDGHPGREWAVVDADLCAGCGICAGACPSSTPFRSTARLVTGIDMPQLPIGALRSRLRQRIDAPASTPPIVVFGCAQGADVASLADAEILTLPLICTGQMPPSFVEYALRDGAAGVLVASCRDGGCLFRLGARWTEERLRGLREPHLRASVPGERVELVTADAGEEVLLHEALAGLRARLPPRQPTPEVRHG